MCCRLVDELCNKDDGGDHTGDKTDSTDHDVESGKVHDSAEAEEDKKQRKDENTHPNYKMYGNHPHASSD